MEDIGAYAPMFRHHAIWQNEHKLITTDHNISGNSLHRALLQTTHSIPLSMARLSFLDHTFFSVCFGGSSGLIRSCCSASISYRFMSLFSHTSRFYVICIFKQDLEESRRCLETTIAKNISQTPDKSCVLEISLIQQSHSMESVPQYEYKPSHSDL